MLLNIERVLRMLAEGKSVEKIAETAKVEAGEVRAIIEDALKIVLDHDKTRAKKKFTIKKNSSAKDYPAAVQEKGDDDILAGADITVVPIDSMLTIYTDGASSGNPGHSGIGLVIFDNNDRQVGKVSQYIGVQTNNFAEYTAVIKALQLAAYFKAKVIRIRTDSELVVKQINGEYKVKNENIRPLYNRVVKIMGTLGEVRIEHVSRSVNDKADYLAKKAAESRGNE